MNRDFRMAWTCANEALRAFRWGEYAPFGWIFAAQILFLYLATRLETPLGMGTIGGLTRMLGGEASLHYPRFFSYLPTVASYVEAFLYTVPGSLLIPLALIRIERSVWHSAHQGSVARRVGAASLPTLLAWLVQGALLFWWQSIVSDRLAGYVQYALSGFQAVLTVWLVSLLGAFAIAAIFLYIPIVAIRSGSSFLKVLRRGVREGFAFLWCTLFFILFFSWPALLFLLATQLQADVIVRELRPEVVALLLGIYAALMSVASYFTFAAASRFHRASRADKR